MADRITSFKINDKEFNRFKQLIYDLAGIKLNDSKKDLVISRLGKRLRHLGIGNFSDYYEYVTREENANELNNMINRITTNKTDFFREKYHFDFLTNHHLPEFMKHKGNEDFIAWSAGCSSGEEPYTLAIVLEEFKSDHPNFNYKILATDIDTEILKKASFGAYLPPIVEPVPKPLLSKYFTKIRESQLDYYKINQRIREKISFRKLNFRLPDYRLKVKFDVIFFRNVMIYFDDILKKHILGQFYKSLKNDGLVLIGHSESLLFMREHFKYLRNTIYMKEENV